MRENLERGWKRFHDYFDRFVPNFGPTQAANPQPVYASQGQIPDGAFPDGGVGYAPTGVPPVVLHRLDAPAGIGIGYRSQAYYYMIEAILFFAALGFGIRLNWYSGVKFAYACFVGISMVIAGVVDPRGAGKWEAIYLGVLFFRCLSGWPAGFSGKWCNAGRHGIKLWRERERTPKVTCLRLPPSRLNPSRNHQLPFDSDEKSPEIATGGGGCAGSAALCAD